jgi:hypothetical protein
VHAVNGEAEDFRMQSSSTTPAKRRLQLGQLFATVGRPFLGSRKLTGVGSISPLGSSD